MTTLRRLGRCLLICTAIGCKEQENKVWVVNQSDDRMVNVRVRLADRVFPVIAALEPGGQTSVTFRLSREAGYEVLFDDVHGRSVALRECAILGTSRHCLDTS